MASDAGLALASLAQEAVANAVLAGRAHNIGVELYGDEEQTGVRVWDDAESGPIAVPTRELPFDHNEMREQAQRMGAEVSFTRDPAMGNVVEIRHGAAETRRSA